jgi:glycosyltransferase involved in cell wall biosynthesis
MSVMDRGLRVALLAGGLSQGGAEKQLLYMVKALRERCVTVRVYCLTRGEHYEPALQRAGVPPIWIGHHQNPLLRTLALARKLRTFRPHVVQAAHFFTNLHVTLAARLAGAQAIGSIRNDAFHEVQANGRWGRWLLSIPPAIVANSNAAAHNAEALGADPTRIHVVSNVLDLDEFDRSAIPVTDAGTDRVVAIAVCRLVAAKRIDRYLRAMAMARRRAPVLHGVIVGEGPERSRLEELARSLGLLPDGVTFLGRRNDVPAILRSGHLLVVSSDHEGFPNVILEAMAARLPVVTTPAGDAGTIVRHGELGFVVPANDVEQMADRLVELATKHDVRRRFGDACRMEVERRYTQRTLADSLLAVYGALCSRRWDARLLARQLN